MPGWPPPFAFGGRSGASPRIWFVWPYRQTEFTQSGISWKISFKGLLGVRKGLLKHTSPGRCRRDSGRRSTKEPVSQTVVRHDDGVPQSQRRRVVEFLGVLSEIYHAHACGARGRANPRARGRHRAGFPPSQQDVPRGGIPAPVAGVHRGGPRRPGPEKKARTCTYGTRMLRSPRCHPVGVGAKSLRVVPTEMVLKLALVGARQSESLYDFNICRRSQSLPGATGNNPGNGRRCPRARSPVSPTCWIL